MKKLFCLLLPLLLSGCTTVGKMQSASAGPTGCSPQAIEISNHQSGFNSPETWEAKCDGKKYICSAFGFSVNCSPSK